LLTIRASGLVALVAALLAALIPLVALVAALLAALIPLVTLVALVGSRAVVLGLGIVLRIVVLGIVLDVVLGRRGSLGSSGTRAGSTPSPVLAGLRVRIHFPPAASPMRT
jgi:hypothetical protein